MTVKLSDIKAKFPNALHYKQVNYKQLFIILFPDYKLLISYRTIMGFKQSGIWYITTEHYSKTTAKQIIQAISQTLKGDIVRLDPETFNDRLYNIGK